jgi:hypothetical protein
MLTYAQVAARLGIPRGTLSRKLAEFNKSHPLSERINPDKIEPRGYARVHLFGPEGIDRLETMVKQSRCRAGRPVKNKHPNKGATPS